MNLDIEDEKLEQKERKIINLKNKREIEIGSSIKALILAISANKRLVQFG